MLHHGGDGDGGHDQDGGQVELGYDELLQTHEAGLLHGSEAHKGLHDTVGIRELCAAGGGDECHDIGAHHTQQDGDDLDHALAPDVGHDDDGDGYQCQPPAGGGVGDGRACQVQTDHDDHGAGDDGGEVAHDLLGADDLEEQCQNQIQSACHHNAAQSIGQLFVAAHGGVFAGIQAGHGLEAAQIGEGGAQESGHLKLGAHMEDQRAETGHQQRGLDGQGQAVPGHQNGDQHCGAEHGEQVLQAQHQHPGQAEGAGVGDGFIA